MEQRNGLFLF